MDDSLFHSIIFGPVRSRRLGISLGINLLPLNVKFCTFNCVYCECGWTDVSDSDKVSFHPKEEIASLLEEKLIYLKKENLKIDSITYAGNGEPTAHPQFSEIVDDTIRLRDKYFPEAKVTVLSNSTYVGNDKIREALLKTNNIMKLDAGTEETFLLINKPRIKITQREIVNNLKKFNGNLIIQSMFIRGTVNGKPVDNTSEKEITPWLAFLQEIQPKEVMLYSIDRRPPTDTLEKISEEELKKIADKVQNINLKASVY